jgi:RHS repeat-associated protein
LNANPYTRTPSNLDPNLSTTGWSRPSGTFTNFNGISGTRAIAFENTSADTSYVTLNLSVDEAKLLDIASFSFYHRSSPTGYNAYKLVINGIEVGSGSIFVSSGNSLQHTGTINVANAVSGLSGNVTVTLKLFGGLKGALGTFRMDDFVLNGYTTATENWSPAGYRYGFNSMEKDDEVKGGGNSYDFGARMYDSRVGRWWSRDAFERKYPDLSPYHFAMCSPLIVIDPNGKENIIVASYDGGGKDKYKFINSALLQASINKEENPKEKTTILLMTFNMTKEQMEWVREEANKLDVKLVEISSTEQIVNYINSRNIYTSKYSSKRENDKITDLSFFSHGYSEGMNGSSSIEPAHGIYGIGSLDTEYDFNNRTNEQKKHDSYTFDKDDVLSIDPRAFKSKSNCDIYSCNSATKNINGESLVKSFSKQLPKTVTSGYVGRTDYIGIYGWYKGNEKVMPADYLPVGGQQSNGNKSFKVTYKNGTKI